MSRAVSFSEIKNASPEMREKALAGVISESRAPMNGHAEDLDREIAGYEESYGIDSAGLLEELSAGERRETEDILHWLMLLRLRERVGSASTS
jgi:hypothetical protein